MAAPPLRILVGIKRVVDYAVKVRTKPDHSGVDVANLKMSMNPFCELAVEAAVQLRERLGPERVTDLVAASVGPPASQETLRTALAMGMDRAVLVNTENTPNPTGDGASALSAEPLEVARVLAAMQVRTQANLIILGKQAIDDDANQTGQMLAGLMNWSQVSGTLLSVDL
jgi:electron transfer flavoprotein beta subunit